MMVMVAEMIMVRRLSSFGWDKGNGRVEERERGLNTPLLELIIVSMTSNQINRLPIIEHCCFSLLAHLTVNDRYHLKLLTLTFGLIDLFTIDGNEFQEWLPQSQCFRSISIVS